MWCLVLDIRIPTSFLILINNYIASYLIIPHDACESADERYVISKGRNTQLSSTQATVQVSFNCNVAPSTYMYKGLIRVTVHAYIP